MLLITITTPDGTLDIPGAVAHALNNPDHYPPVTQTPMVWDVGIAEAGAFLGQFEALDSGDPAKDDLELVHTVCGLRLCDVQDGDELAVLIGMAADHDCPGPWTAEAAAELNRLEAEFDAAGWRDPELADEIDAMAARRNWAASHGWVSPVPDPHGRASEITDL
jgi:hypothetical protein